MRNPSRTRPPALRPGDTVAVVAPASDIKREALERGCEGLRRLGYRILFKESIAERDLYFAGSVRRRARELEEMFAREEVRAIVCARGGYGSNYLLEELDLARVLANPKIFVGYSDITALLTYLCDAGNLVTFHGPMVCKDFGAEDGVDQASWLAATGGAAEWTFAPDTGAVPLVRGNAEGVLYGGCLSILVASLATPFEINTGGTVLFLEDVNAKPYQVDRMLMQLKLAGKLEAVRGIIFGEMLDCRQTPNQGYALEEVVTRVVGDFAIPVVYGLRSGHVSRRNVTLPLGTAVALQVGDEVRLKVLEPATAAASDAVSPKSK